MGSSLGGYYATWLAENARCARGAGEPGDHSALGLRAYLGTQTNLYTGEPYELTEQHLSELQALWVERPDAARSATI